MEQGEHLGCAMALVLMGKQPWVPFWLPTRASRRHGLKWSRFIFIPNRQSQSVSHAIGTLNQGLFGCRIRIGDGDGPALAFAYGLARLHPTSALLPAIACLVQDTLDRISAHLWQATDSLAQDPFEQSKGPCCGSIRFGIWHASHLG